MWDENGDWLDNEPETSKVLNRLLCRPLNQMWKESPEARARHGQVSICHKLSCFRWLHERNQMWEVSFKAWTLPAFVSAIFCVRAFVVGFGNCFRVKNG